MRRVRWLILAAIILIAIAIYTTYVQRKAALARDTVQPPPPLEKGIDGRANDWVYTQSDGDRPKVTVRAKSFKQVRAPSVMQLEGVELQLFHKDGTAYDLVHSAEAEFDITGKSLYSEGEVEIEMGIPEDGSKPPGRILKVHATGVHFASDTGKATTDRAASFEFEQGGGSATGAEYDPASRQLHLLHDVKLDWRGKNKDAKPMHVEAGEALYAEMESGVQLLQWSKLKRDTLNMEAGPAIIKLMHGAVQEVVTESAHGVQDEPGRKLEFAAEHFQLEFGEGMIVRKIQGQQNGKLVSTSKGVQTTVTTDAVILDFTAVGKQSILANAVAAGRSVAEAKPLPQSGELLADTRVLRSEVIRLKMRGNGQDIESVITDGPGTVDFLPNRPTQPKRWMKGDRIWINYGMDNRIETFRAINAFTRTDKPAEKLASLKSSDPQSASAPQLTQSKELLATFDPKTSDLLRLEQKTDFKYEEGPRHATADRAMLDQAKDAMTLDGAARVWDPTGSASGDHLAMNQKTGDYLIEGHVATTRVPEDKGNPGMLSSSEVMQARAQRMTSSANNQKLHYEGGAVAWQGANRVEADRLEIDRTRHIMEAHGKVVSQFLDKDKNESDKSGAKATNVTVKNKETKTVAKSAPIFTVVRAADLIYDQDSRIANYVGSAALSRPGLAVTGQQIRAFLNAPDANSSLDKALADGEVKIVHTAGPRTRVGTSEHAEYYTEEQKVLLDGGTPTLVDSLKGETKGRQLTWFANNDRLLVNGVESRPADSLLRKK
jgi:lipopolysaccharide export system protein LptA